MKSIRHTATLFYYDGPQVFEARDAIGGHYIAVMVEPEAGRDRCAVVGADPERLRQLRCGMLDLRALMVERAEHDWYLATMPESPEQSLPLVAQVGDIAASGFLPDAGFVLNYPPAQGDALREARERNNLVLEIAVEPPESAQEHRIHAGTLVGLLNHLDVLVSHAYRRAVRDLSAAARRSIDRSDDHLMDVVVPAAAGSFRVVLVAAKGPDLLGSTELARALRRVDDLLEDVGDPQRALATTKANRGHLAGAYLRLLRFLVESRCGLHYAWAEPSFQVSRTRAVTEREAGSLVDLLSSVSNLGTETVLLTGALEKLDVRNGSWRLATEDGERSGKTKPGGPSLAGLKGGGFYRFTCTEEIEKVQGSGREVRTLYLTEHEPA